MAEWIRLRPSKLETRVRISHCKHRRSNAHFEVHLRNYSNSVIIQWMLHKFSSSWTPKSSHHYGHPMKPFTLNFWVDRPSNFGQITSPCFGSVVSNFATPIKTCSLQFQICMLVEVKMTGNVDIQWLKESFCTCMY